MGVVSITAPRVAGRERPAQRRSTRRPSQKHTRPGSHGRGRGTRSAPEDISSAGATSERSTVTQRINVSRVVRVAAISIVSMIAVAVAIQAQQVAGQQLLDEVRSEAHAQSRIQADLRAEVAEAEAPSALLHTAEELGMVEPGAVVAVPASGAVPSAGRDDAAVQERG